MKRVLDAIIVVLALAFLVGVVASLKLVAQLDIERSELGFLAFKQVKSTTTFRQTVIPTERASIRVQEVSPTSTPIPTATPTPEPYLLWGMDFDGLESNGKRITISIQYLNGFEIDFLPVAYQPSMGSDCGDHFRAGLRRACVFASGGHIAVAVHSGCFPEPLPAEPLVAFLDQRQLCGWPTKIPSGYQSLEGSKVNITDGVSSFEGKILLVDYISHERLEEFKASMNPADMAEFIGRTDLLEGKRLIWLITSGRGEEERYTRANSAHWIVVIGR